MTTMGELEVVDLPPWPGPRRYRWDYVAGWEAFADAVADGLDKVVDPGDVVPPMLTDPARRISWIMGYGEHQMALVTWERAVWGGAPTDTATVHAAVQRAVGDKRADTALAAAHEALHPVLAERLEEVVERCREMADEIEEAA